MFKYLKRVRTEKQPKPQAYHIMIQIFLVIILGALFGVLAKYSDTVPSNGANGFFFHFISIITTRLGIWIAAATIIAAWSASPMIAVMRVISFFAGMLLAYYIYSRFLFGFFPTYYFLRWGGIAVFSSAAAYILWFSRGKGWFAAICAALPIGLLLDQGYPFFYLHWAELSFDILAATLLLIILPKQKMQCFKIAPIAVLIAFILRETHLISYFMGGL